MKICQKGRYSIKFDPLQIPDQYVRTWKITEMDKESPVLVHKVDQLWLGTDKGFEYLTKPSKRAIFVEICPISALCAPQVSEGENQKLAKLINRNYILLIKSVMYVLTSI